MPTYKELAQHTDLARLLYAYNLKASSVLSAAHRHGKVRGLDATLFSAVVRNRQGRRFTRAQCRCVKSGLRKLRIDPEVISRVRELQDG
jgi:hypothetical protein